MQYPHCLRLFQRKGFICVQAADIPRAVLLIGDASVGIIVGDVSFCKLKPAAIDPHDGGLRIPDIIGIMVHRLEHAPVQRRCKRGRAISHERIAACGRYGLALRHGITANNRLFHTSPLSGYFFHFLYPSTITAKS